MKLTVQARKSAEHYIESSARPLEQALLAHHFGRGPADAVQDALTAFRNDDGGFGHGLEPDVRLADSSVICTTVALQILRSICAPAEHPNVTGAIRYLIEQYNAEADNWELVPSNVDDAAHAPWWTYGPASATRPFNPRADILGHMLTWPDQVPEDLLHNLKDRVIRDVSQASDEMDMHDTFCCTRLLETSALQERDREIVLRKLGCVVVKTVVTNRAEWNGYCLKPIDVAPTPQSPLAQYVHESIPASLDHLIGGQSSDGGWPCTWSWEAVAPDEWAAAEQEWRGSITLNALRTLDAWGRLP